MTTVAEEMRRENTARLRGMTPTERLAEAFALGEAAVALHAAAHDIDLEEARRRLERAAQSGRRPSRVMLEIIG
jgi:hypothetical protein